VIVRRRLASSGARCIAPAERLGRSRVFGFWTNLYTVRDGRSLGFGDLSSLARIVAFAGELGAAFVGLNPLHALRNRGREISPYAPVSRLFRNPLYLDVRAVPGFADCAEARGRLASPEAAAALERARAADRLDHEALAALQRSLLEPLFARFEAAGRADASRRRDFDAFCQRGGELLEDFAVFCALEEHLETQGYPPDWRAWPAGYRDPRGAGVCAFAERHAPRVAFHAWVQFELDRQLAGVARAARRAGLAVGLYQDLALGSLASGFDAWAFPDLFRRDVHVGAPPDDYAAQGQDWGIPPMDPERLAARGYDYWRALLRAGFAHAGALRIDHVLGLVRQFWIPAGRPPREGAYVPFPARDLMTVVAEESRRHEALVIGEDLGTVPPGMAARLARYGILSSRVMLFERDPSGAFRPASRYSPRALVTANTHDLPPLRGWWEARDLALREVLGLVSAEEARARRREREAARRALRRRLVRDGHLPPEPDPDPARLAGAVHAFLARTPSPLLGVSLDDLTGEAEPVNVPGVGPERHPSWSRRMGLALDAIPDDPGVRRALQGLDARGGSWP